MTGRVLGLYPRAGFVAPGICDSWHCFLGEERIDETCLAFMTDLVPSLSDTMLRNGGIYDAYTIHQQAREWADKYPGTIYQRGNTLAEVWISTRFLLGYG